MGFGQIGSCPGLGGGGGNGGNCSVGLESFGSNRCFEVFRMVDKGGVKYLRKGEVRLVGLVVPSCLWLKIILLPK